MENMIGRNVKAYLESRGITQVFVSKETGIPTTVLNDRLNGKSEFKAKELYAIGEVLGVPLETFRARSRDNFKSA